MKDLKRNKAKNHDGFSLPELLLMAMIIVILTTVSLFFLTAQEKLYNVDEQSLLIVDIFQEARQRSLTQREVMRVELDLEENIARLIDENETGDATDDDLVREVALLRNNLVRIDRNPTNVGTVPPEPLPIPLAQYRGSLHPLSAGHNVATFRFMLNGTIEDAGTNAAGSGSVTKGATIFIWKPKDANENQSDLTRSITILGATGSVRMWSYVEESNGQSYWKDSRRASYGGGTGSGSPIR